MNTPIIPLDFSQIEIPANRVRDLDEERLERITISMREMNSQMTPIEVVEQPGAARPYRLVYGLHRLKAAEAAGLGVVLAQVYVGEADEVTLRLREVDENLARADLSPYDRVNFIRERCELWEKKNNKIQRGMLNRQIGGLGVERAKAVKEIAEKIGLSLREVERDRTRMKKICDEVWGALRGTHVANSGVQIDQIARLKQEQQVALIERLRPHFSLAKAEFGAKFTEALHAVTGAKQVKGKPQTDEQIAQKVVDAYLLLLPDQQEIFRRKTGLKLRVHAAKPGAAS